MPPATAAWLSATIGEALADGSEVSTGRGARLIVDAPGRNISVGPNSRFVLPGSDGDDLLDQRAGSLRYRVAEAAEPLHIHTRSLELELLAGVVDVHVNHLATEVSVKEGQVRVATPDGLRQTQMIAGQSAHAGGSDEVQLAVRSAPGGPFQPVELVIVPAIQPKAAPAEMPRTSAAAPSPTAGLPALRPATRQLPRRSTVASTARLLCCTKRAGGSGPTRRRRGRSAVHRAPRGRGRRARQETPQARR